MDMSTREFAPIPPDNVDYHRTRAQRERELAMRADDPSAVRAHTMLAELHEAEADGGRMTRVVV